MKNLFILMSVFIFSLSSWAGIIGDERSELEKDQDRKYERKCEELLDISSRKNYEFSEGNLLIDTELVTFKKYGSKHVRCTTSYIVINKNGTVLKMRSGVSFDPTTGRILTLGGSGPHRSFSEAEKQRLRELVSNNDEGEKATSNCSTSVNDTDEVGKFLNSYLENVGNVIGNSIKK